MITFQLKDIRKTFQSGDIEEEVLKGVNLSLEKGRVTALTGTSGSGKSTLLTIAACLQTPSSGRILFQGENLASLREKNLRKVRAEEFGFIFQSSHLVPFLTVEEQLEMMVEVSGKQGCKKDIDSILRRVGLSHRQNSYPSSLSGGEKQRAAIARAVIHRPAVLFADEPTASLDSKKSMEVMTLLQDMTTSLGMSTLLVTHEEEMLAFADQVVRMEDGRVTDR
ncbi:ABC transporter ATP-binding protein [Salimicrobium flavidum]|uniref:Putative hemin import ATP-binding protein HrtA n=1 Tax=Salimicrobium flavidum TaxID=570947 RepID=A0A1N7JA96_9BACI|nr:ABC transporter ATP-binding protein [Salimicrobium flavidum]SIS46214.1 putative ABC transport system ATP-binding protein [Salimicrobium flavidum]